jgi:hypothetical protein
MPIANANANANANAHRRSLEKYISSLLFSSPTKPNNHRRNASYATYPPQPKQLLPFPIPSRL